MRILVAGIGNIFLGDDGFGVEVVRQLKTLELPKEVQVVEFATRSYDLLYALLGEPDVTILVDASARGQSPGTLCLIEPNLAQLPAPAGELVDAHSMNPMRVLQMVKALGYEPGPLYLLGCEPAVLECENGQIRLSAPVAAAIPHALSLLQSLFRHLILRSSSNGLQQFDKDDHRSADFRSTQRTLLDSSFQPPIRPGRLFHMIQLSTIEAVPEEIYDIELEQSLLAANAQLAAENRRLLDQHGIRAIDFMGAIGSGKTTLIARLVAIYKDQLGVAVFNGDATTSNDADLIADQQIPVVQIATVNGCHLDANLVGKALQKIALESIDLLLIENIGNLICPAEFPLGSRARVVVVSVTEGPWMVRKHPHMFCGAAIVVINKADLAEVMEVSIEALRQDVHNLKPDIKVIATSCRTGLGLQALASALLTASDHSDA